MGRDIFGVFSSNPHFWPLEAYGLIDILRGGDPPNDTFPEKTSGSSYFTGKMEGKVPGVVG